MRLTFLHKWLGLTLASLAIVNSLSAATVTWTGSVSTVWNVDGNWDTGSVPGPDDDVVVNGNVTGPPLFLPATEINLSTPQVINSLTINNGVLNLYEGLEVSGDINLSTGSSEIKLQNFGSGFIGSLIIGGELNSSGSVSSISGTTIEYNGDNSQTVVPLGYSNLTLSGAGEKLISVVSGLSVSGTFDGSSSIVNFNSSTAISVPNFGTYGSVRFTGGGSKTLLEALVLEGSLEIENGTALIVNGQRISFEGSGASVFVNGNSSSLSLVELEMAKFSGSLTLSGSFEIPTNGAILFGSGSGNFDTGGDLLINAQQGANGRIGSYSNYTVTGEVTCEQYINSQSKVWWHMGMPVSPVSVSDIQDDFPVTGSFSGADEIALSANGPSVKGYTESGISSTGNFLDGWTNFPSSSNSETFTVGQGYRAFIRQDTASADPVTIDVTGQLTKEVTYGPLSRGACSECGWHLLSNPFMSSISTSKINSASESGVFVWNATAADWESPAEIAPFQAFMMESNGSTTFTLDQTDKVDGFVSFMKQAADENVLKVVFRSSHSNGDNEKMVKVVVDEFATSGFDQGLDLGYLPRNMFVVDSFEHYLDMATVIEGGRKSFENHIPVAEEERVQLVVEYGDQNDYTLSVLKSNFSVSADVVLVDNLTGETIESEGDALVYNFSVDNASHRTVDEDRFELVVTSRIAGSEDALSSSFELYPNPTDGQQLTVRSSKVYGDVEVSVVDMTGNVLFSKLMENDKSSFEEVLSLEGVLESGVYFLNLKSQGAIETKKFVVK